MEEIEETIDLQELFQILKKHLLLIFALAVSIMALSGVFTLFFITPVYQTSTQLILVPRVSEGALLTQGEINANLQMINTFNEVLVSPMILNEVIDELDLTLTAGSLRSMVTARNTTNSQVITLTVQNENAELASKIANTTAEIFKMEVLENFNMDNVRILADAQIPNRPISPRPLLNVGIGLVIGAMIGIFLAFLLEFLDKTVKTEQEVEKLIGVPVIGIIPIMRAEDIVKKRS